MVSHETWRSQREHFLRSLNEATGGDYSAMLGWERFVRKLGFGPEIAVETADYFKANGMVWRAFNNVGITAKGVEALALLQDNPDYLFPGEEEIAAAEPEPAPPPPPEHVEKPHAHKSHSHSPHPAPPPPPPPDFTMPEPPAPAAHAAPAIKRHALHMFVNALGREMEDLSLDDSLKAELFAELKTIEVQLASPNPKADIINICVDSIADILCQCPDKKLAGAIVTRFPGLFNR